MRKLRIAVVSKADSGGGGASRVAEDVARTLGARGHEATHFVSWSTKGYATVRPLYGPTPVRVATRALNAAVRRLGLGESVPFELPAVLMALRSGFDLAHVHDTTSTLSPVTMRAVSRLLPTMWTLHDCSAFTGGCLYPQTYGCGRYRTGCGSCPARGDWPLDGPLDGTRLGLALRRRALADGRILVAAPSSWMADVAAASGNMPRRPEVVPNMVDTSTFAPAADRATLRRELGLPSDRPVLVSSAGSVTDARKGIGSVVAAAADVAARGLAPVLVMIGDDRRGRPPGTEGLEVVTTGFLRDRAELARWLAASDAFVFCATAENQPLAVLETLACGTPVYGWPTGGVPEMVLDRVHGRLVTGHDVAALGAAIAGGWTDGSMAGMRAAARERALGYGEEAFYLRHMDAYGKLLGERG